MSSFYGGKSELEVAQYEIKKLREDLDFSRVAVNNLTKINNELSNKNEKSKKALEFYSLLGCPVNGDNDEIQAMSDMDNAPYFRGGKRARQALKEVGE